MATNGYSRPVGARDLSGYSGFVSGVNAARTPGTFTPAPSPMGGAMSDTLDPLKKKMQPSNEITDWRNQWELGKIVNEFTKLPDTLTAPDPAQVSNPERTQQSFIGPNRYQAGNPNGYTGFNPGQSVRALFRALGGGAGGGVSGETALMPRKMNMPQIQTNQGGDVRALTQILTGGV